MSNKPPHQRPAVLIISDRWGSFFEGGPPAAVRLLAHLFNSLGLAVFCTVLKMTKQQYADAKKNNVELISPEPRKAFKRKNPHPDWFLAFEAYFPNLFEIDNIAIGVGFSFITSDAASLIIEKVVPKAKYYLANVWPSDVSPVVVGCESNELQDSLDNLEDEINLANAIVSFDVKTFDDFKQRFHDIEVDHFLLSLLADEKLLNSNQPILQANNPTRQILSFIEEYDFEEMQSHHNLAKAINRVAENFHASFKEPPRWRILSIPEAKECYYLRKLNPHEHLKIVPSSMPTAKYMEREIRCSHLILIPPSPGLNSYHLMLSAMAIGIPFLVSMHSACHAMIRKYFLDQEYICVVDMDDVEKLKDRISLILEKPEVYFKKAHEMKERLRTEVLPTMKNMNEMFVDKLKEDLYDAKPSPAAEDAVESQGDSNLEVEIDDTAERFSAKDTTTTATDQTPYTDPGVNPIAVSSDASGALGSVAVDQAIGNGDQRCLGHINLHLNAAGGIPKAGKSITDVEKAYFKSQEVLEETPENINNIHQGLQVDAINGHSVRYSIACETLDALECLWKEYEALNLNRLISSVTITERSLNEIGALYFSIQTTLDIEEYELCKQELLERGDVAMSIPTEVVDSNGKDSQKEVELTEENNKLRLETYKLKSTISSLQRQLILFEARVQHLNTALNKGKADVAILQSTLEDKCTEIEILKKNLEEKERDEKILFDKMLLLSKEHSQLKVSVGETGVTSLSDENRQLKEDVTNLKKEVESLEEKNISNLKDIDRLQMEMDKVKGQWKVTRTLDGESGPVLFKDVQGVTINHLDQVVMAHCGNNCVLTLNSSYEVDSEIRFDGHFPNEFEPYDVAVTASNTYLMTDTGNDQVVVYDKNSKTTQTFCQNDDIEPRGIASLDEGFVVTDRKGHRVIKYGMNDEIVAEAGGHVKPRRLTYPQCVVVNSDNNVIVSDQVSATKSIDTIQVFNCQLQFLFTLTNTLWGPLGLSVDSWDNIYCMHGGSGGSTIIKFTKNGEFVEEFGDDIDNAGYITVAKQCKKPTIVVSDPRFNRITVYTK